MQTNTPRPDKTGGTDTEWPDLTDEQTVFERIEEAIRGPDAKCGNSPAAVIAYAERHTTADFIEVADALEHLIDRGDVLRTEHGLEAVEADGGTTTDRTVHPTTCTRFQLDQLAAIAYLQATDTVCSGAAIKAQLQIYLDEEILPARIYQNLDDLVEAGLLERTQHDGRTYEYALTAAGRACLHERIQWLADQAGLRVVDADREARNDMPVVVDEGGTAGGRE